MSFKPSQTISRDQIDFEYDKMCNMVDKLGAQVVKLRARIAELENTWISVEDRLPEDNQPVMAACKMDTGEWWFGNCIYHGYFTWVQLGNPLSPVTHWQPIRPPKEDSK